MCTNRPYWILSMDMDREFNGYYPGVKGTYVEQFVYCDGPQYEDCGIKHLYEQHHRCTTESGPCERFCRMRLRVITREMILSIWKMKK